MSEVAGILDCSGERSGGDRTDARDRHEKLTGLALACTSNELAPKFGGMQADATPGFQKWNHDGRKIASINNKFANVLFKLASLAWRNDQAERLHQTSDLIGKFGGDVDQLGACCDQSAR